MQPTEPAPALWIEGDLGVVIERDGVPVKLGDAWAVQLQHPEVFAQLTAEHFRDCARRHPEIGLHCAAFIQLLEQN